MSLSALPGRVRRRFTENTCTSSPASPPARPPASLRTSSPAYQPRTCTFSHAIYLFALVPVSQPAPCLSLLSFFVLLCFTVSPYLFPFFLSSSVCLSSSFCPFLWFLSVVLLFVHFVISCLFVLITTRNTLYHVAIVISVEFFFLGF